MPSSCGTPSTCRKWWRNSDAKATRCTTVTLPASGRCVMNTSMSTAVFTSTSRRRSGERDYAPCGQRVEGFLNDQNCSIAIGHPRCARLWVEAGRAAGLGGGPCWTTMDKRFIRVVAMRAVAWEKQGKLFRAIRRFIRAAFLTAVEMESLSWRKPAPPFLFENGRAGFLGRQGCGGRPFPRACPRIHDNRASSGACLSTSQNAPFASEIRLENRLRTFDEAGRIT